jgi:hypothetical protein
MEWLHPHLLASSNQCWVVLRTRDRYPLVINLGIYYSLTCQFSKKFKELAREPSIICWIINERTFGSLKLLKQPI